MLKYVITLECSNTVFCQYGVCKLKSRGSPWDCGTFDRSRVPGLDVRDKAWVQI